MISAKTQRIRSSFAKDKNGIEITIRIAERGRLGYFCPDCDREMEAVKPLGAKPRPYFRHIVTDLKIDAKPCLYSDETYRHKLAKEFLVAGKSIRVPKVAAFPPKGYDGPTKTIRPARTITAYAVGVEIDFFEDDFGNLCWDKIDNSQTKNFWVRPDVVFFDNQKKPILFIELVATHRPDLEKLEKIRKLGIDTVMVKVPLESSKEIEECFKHTECTKWLYNNEYERSDYFQLPGSRAERFSDDDREQRKILGERYACTKNRLGNLIRKIDRILESKHYLEIEGRLRTTIQELKTEQSRRQYFIEQLDRQAYDSLRERRSEIQNRQAKLDRVRIYIQRRTERINDEILKGLSDRRSKNKMEQERLNRLRYSFAQRIEDRKRTLELEEASIDNLTRISTKGPAREGSDTAIAHERVRAEIEEVEESIRKTESDIKGIQKQMESIREDFERERNSIIERFKREEEVEEQRFRWLKRNEEKAIDDLGREEEGFVIAMETKRRELEQRIQREEGEIIAAIEKEDAEGDSIMSREIKAMVRARQLLADYPTSLAAHERNEQALRYLNSEAFKNWVKRRKARENI